MRRGLPATTFPPMGGSLTLCALKQGFSDGNRGFNPQVKLFSCIWWGDTSLQHCIGVLPRTTGSGLSAAKWGEMPALAGDCFRAPDRGLGIATKGSSEQQVLLLCLHGLWGTAYWRGKCRLTSELLCSAKAWIEQCFTANDDLSWWQN